MFKIVKKTNLLKTLENLKKSHTVSFSDIGIPKKKSTGKKRFRLDPVSEDAEYLCSHVSGLNYKNDTEPVKIKPDSEYPDWIWSIRLEKHPGYKIYEPDTKEFWEEVSFENVKRVKKLLRTKEKLSKTVGKNLLKQEELKERFKKRLLDPIDFDQGYYPEELRPKLPKDLYLRPQVKKETIYMDEIELPRDFS